MPFHSKAKLAHRQPFPPNLLLHCSDLQKELQLDFRNSSAPIGDALGYLEEFSNFVMQHNSISKTHTLYDPEVLPSAGACYVCDCIRRLFVEDEVFIELGEGKGTPCAAHDAVLSWFKGTFDEEVKYLASQGAPHYSRRLSRQFTVGFERRIGASPQIQIHNDRRRTEWSRIALCQIPDESQAKSYEDSFDPEWIDLQAARQWLGHCVENHGIRCRNTFGTFLCAPAYLIDTELDCIVEGKPGLEYVALSYTWGTHVDTFRTNKSNFDSLTVPGGVSKQTKIPDTIKHAMHVVFSLGERYLWVDSLCINCDDKVHLQEQLQIMGSIYTCAKLTIVSADGDAWDGLHGIRHVSQPRKLPNVFPWLNGIKLVVRDLPALSARRSTYELGPTSEYFRRGWTFQEYLLSRRRLIFGKRQIHWNCACATFHEDRPDRKNQYLEDPALHLSVPNILSGIPDFDELKRLLNEYHMRHFTRPEDALPGITGFLNLLKHSFRGGFLCGLPQMRFDAALMWHCGLGTSDLSGHNMEIFLEPRKHSVSQEPALPGAMLPYWSWVSWRGNNLRLLDQEENYQLPKDLRDAKYRPNYITAPITTWYSHDTPFSGNKRRIDSFSDCKNDSRNPEFVSQGWTEEHCDLTKHFGDSANNASEEDKRVTAHKYVYHHPDLPNNLFWRPFSILAFEQHDEHAGARELQQCQYISCRTQRRWFHVRNLNLSRFGTKYEPQYVYDVSFEAQIIVVDDLDQVCGWLQAPSEPATSEFQNALDGNIELGSSIPISDDPDCTDNNALPRRKVELVAVCHRRVSDISGMERTTKETRNGFYGVLWVEWKDRVAYRKGCGYVEKGVWDQSGAEQVDLILG